VLSDHEREALVDIERRLLADDPAWTTAFDVTGRRAVRHRAPGSTFHIVATVFSVALVGLMLAAHASGPALFFATVTGLLLCLIRRRRGSTQSRAEGPVVDKPAPGDSGAGPPQT
jgi:hypothetical protein